MNTTLSVSSSSETTRSTNLSGETSSATFEPSTTTTTTTSYGNYSGKFPEDWDPTIEFRTTTCTYLLVVYSFVFLFVLCVCLRRHRECRFTKLQKYALIVFSTLEWALVTMICSAFFYRQSHEETPDEILDDPVDKPKPTFISESDPDELLVWAVEGTISLAVILFRMCIQPNVAPVLVAVLFYGKMIKTTYLLGHMIGSRYLWSADVVGVSSLLAISVVMTMIGPGKVYQMRVEDSSDRRHENDKNRQLDDATHDDVRMDLLSADPVIHVGHDENNVTSKTD